VAEALEYGIVATNASFIYTKGAPFGGVKESSIGGEGSNHGIQDFLAVKYLRPGNIESDVEAKMHDVAVAHDVVLALQAHLAGFLGAMLALAGNEIGV